MKVGKRHFRMSRQGPLPLRVAHTKPRARTNGIPQVRHAQNQKRPPLLFSSLIRQSLSWNILICENVKNQRLQMLKNGQRARHDVYTPFGKKEKINSPNCERWKMWKVAGPLSRFQGVTVAFWGRALSLETKNNVPNTLPSCNLFFALHSLKKSPYCPVLLSENGPGDAPPSPLLLPTVTEKQAV